jgi:uncharacterized protein involved in exopolysaccharide biosynthesis
MSPQQILSILLRRSWMIGLALISTLLGAAGILLLVPPRYDAVATASIDPGQVDPVTGQTQGGSLLGILQGNLVALAQSQRVATEVVKRLNLARDPALAAAYTKSSSRDRMSIEEWIAGEYLLRGVQARFTPGSNILTITYKTNTATQSALIANTFLSSFIDSAVELKTAAATQTATWFAPQMEKMKAGLKEASDKLAAFQSQTKLLAPSKDAVDSDSARLAAIDSELTAAKNKLLLVQSHGESGGAKTPTADQKGASLLAESPTLLANKVELAKVNSDIGRLSSEIGPNNPKLASLYAAKHTLEQQINNEIKNRDVALKQQISFLEDSRGKLVQKMISEQSERDQLAALKMEVQTRQAQIESATKTANEARLQSRLSFLNISVLDKAVPPGSPAFPKFKIVVPLAIGAGLALGVIFALLGEALDRRIRGLSDLEFAAGEPVMLGTILSSGKGIMRGRLIPLRLGSRQPKTLLPPPSHRPDYAHKTGRSRRA